MSNLAILRRLKKLEKVFAVEPRDDWIDIVMWNGLQGGIFGHTHCRFSKSRRQTEWHAKQLTQKRPKSFRRRIHKLPENNVHQNKKTFSKQTSESKASKNILPHLPTLESYDTLSPNKRPYYVKNFLGHKSLRSTEIYINIEQTIFEPQSDEFTVKVAEIPEDVKALLEVGFEYVCEKNGLMFFRKRK